MYALVQFTENDGGSISIVKKDWLTPRKCEVYWPPVKGTKAFEKLLCNSSSPTEKWQLYGVQRVFCETDSLEKAKHKLKLAEVTSDLQTEEETEVQKPAKRKAIKRNRYISSDEQEDDENDNYIRPPPLKKHFINLLQDKNNNPGSSSSSLINIIPARTEKTGPNKCSAIQKNHYLLSEEEVDGNENDIVCPHTFKKKVINDITTARENNSNFTQDISIPTLSSSYLENITTARENNSNFMQDISIPTLSSSYLQNLEQGFETNVENHRPGKDNSQLTGYQDKVVSLLTLIKIQNEQILSILKQKRTGVNLKPDYKFPLKTNEELEATEEMLKNDENYENLVLYLETLGGRDTANKVSRIMKTLLTDCLSKEFNFFGKRSQKRPFCQLLLRNCIVEAVKNATGATEKEIEDKIKVWLKHAPERVLKKEKKTV